MFAAPPETAIAEPPAGGARGEAGGAGGLGGAAPAGGSWRRTAHRALVAPWCLVGSLLDSYPALAQAMILLGVVVVAPLALSAAVLAAFSYFV